MTSTRILGQRLLFCALLSAFGTFVLHFLMEHRGRNLLGKGEENRRRIQASGILDQKTWKISQVAKGFSCPGQAASSGQGDARLDRSPCDMIAPSKLMTLDRYSWSSNRSWGHFVSGVPRSVGALEIPGVVPPRCDRRRVPREAEDETGKEQCPDVRIQGSADSILRDLSLHADSFSDFFWNDSDVQLLLPRLVNHSRVGPLLPLILPELFHARFISGERQTPDRGTSGADAAHGCELQTVLSAWSEEFRLVRADAVSDATVWPNGLVVWHEDDAMAHPDRNSPDATRRTVDACARRVWKGTHTGRCQPAKGMPLHQIARDHACAPRIDADVLSIAVADSDRNVFHFLVEALPGLMQLQLASDGRGERLGAEQHQGVGNPPRLVHISKKTKLNLEALELVGVPASRVIDGVIRARRLWLSTTGNCLRPTTWQLRFVRRAFTSFILASDWGVSDPSNGKPRHDPSALPSSASGRTVVAIRRDTTRAVSNWAALLHELRAFAAKMGLGFREHGGARGSSQKERGSSERDSGSSEKREETLLEQALTFRSAHTIVAPHGAGNVFLLAAPIADVRFIELRLSADEWRSSTGEGGAGSSRPAQALPRVFWLTYIRIAALDGMHVWSMQYSLARGVNVTDLRLALDWAGATRSRGCVASV